jgi:hypothetical protein
MLRVGLGVTACRWRNGLRLDMHSARKMPYRKGSASGTHDLETIADD